MDLLSAIGITKQFAAHKALDRVTIGIPENSIFGLLGPNGAGKTTFIRIINQIIAPDEGEVQLNGKPITPADISKIGYLPEERGLYKKMNVGEQAIYLARLKGLSKAEAEKRLRFWFSNFEIMGWWNRKVEELSKGMQQKVQFIVTILHEPRLLIFDEPFSGFDPINVNLLKEEILNLKKNGATIIFSTHNMASVEELCDHIALINNAKTILEGNVREIKKRFKTNTFEIQYHSFQGEFRSLVPPGYEISGESSEEDLRTALVRIPKESSPNDLLNLLIPHISIHALQEIIPSMNDIFIRTVTEQQKQVSPSSN